MPISAESNVKQHVIILQLRYNLSACEAPFRKSEWTLLRSSAKGNLHLHQLRADACALRPHIWVAERRIRVLGQQRISVRTNLHSVGKEFQLRRGKKRIKANVQTKHLRLTFLRATILHDFCDFVNQNAEASKNYSSSPSRIPRWGLILFLPLIFSGDFPAAPTQSADRWGQRRGRRRGCARRGTEWRARLRYQ